MKIIEIIGIDEKNANLLEKEGFGKVEDLIPLTPSQIKKLAKKIGVSAELLDTWQEHADLMRIDGVNPKIANALNLIGIDSVKEFARRNPRNIVTKLKELKKEKPKVLTKAPTESEVKIWILNAKTLSGVPEKKEKKENEIITPPELIEIIPFEGDYGKYGSEYWNNKWEKAPIIYTSRALRGESYKKQIDADVKSFIKDNDAILWHVISHVGLRRDTANETALVIQKFVCDFLKYIGDDESVECPEFWQFPFESIQSEIGDCEDGAILIAGLLINAGIPSWRVKVAAAQVMTNPLFPSSEEGGHAYCIYLADRPESSRKLEWVILDWCYLQDPEVSIENKPLAREGGQDGAYKQIWFTFNDEYSWAQSSFEVKEGRISQNRKAKQEEVLAPLEDILKHLASDELKKIFKKYNIEIE
jgi:predicted transglutaminase-like cysteine proteinase